METKELKEFISELTFDIFDANKGYHHLLLRSSGGMFNPINVDLIFRGVIYVEIPSVLFGISVTKPCDEKAIELEKEYLTYQSVSDEYKGEFVYRIRSREKNFYIVASTLLIQVNNFPKSSLIPICEGGSEHEDYYEKYVKEQYKII